MTTIADIIQDSEALFHESEFLKALQKLSFVIKLQPHHLDARLRIADCLLALGMVQQAAEVYVSLARHAANGGYPLRCLVCLKILGALEPKFQAVVKQVAGFYGAGSERLGRSVRYALGDPNEKVDADALDFERRDSTSIIDAATTIAKTIPESAAHYPEKLPPIPLLSDLSPAGFERLVGACRLRRLRRGQVVMQQGDAGTSFFMIARGSVEVTHEAKDGNKTTLATLGSGSIFGEMSLVSASPRTATVHARDDTDLLEFDREALTAASQDMSAIAKALDEFTRKRLLHNLMNTAPFFRPLDREQRLALLRHFKALDFNSGARVLEEGTEPKGLFVVLRGEVSVSKKDGDDDLLLAKLGAGEVFGEMALLHGTATTAAVTTESQSTLLLLERKHFDALIAAIPAIRNYVEGLRDARIEDTELVLGVGFVTETDVDNGLIEAPAPPPPPSHAQSAYA